MPLAHYVVDYSISMIIDKLKELTTNNKIAYLIKFKTDSISFVGELPSGLDKEDYKGWKEEEYKPTKNILYRESFEESKLELEEWSEEKLIEKLDYVKTGGIFNYNILSDNYAGCGKTYFIINSIIPRINNYNILITAFQHKTLEEYLDL